MAPMNAESAIDQAIALLETEKIQLATRILALDNAVTALRRIQDPAVGAVPDSGRIAPAAVETVTCDVCGKTLKRAGLGPHMSSHRRAQELAEQPATTPTIPQPAASPTPAATQDGLSDEELAETLILLEHPEWIEGAVKKPGSTGWMRADGELWACSCGKKSRLLSQLHQHLRNVVNPKAHRPDVTALQNPPLTSATEPSPAPAPGPDQDTGIVKDLPFGCSCYARFATTREWADHRRTKPTGEQTKHRLIDQPKATMVPTGLPAHPARRDDGPAPHIIQPHAARVGVL